MTMSKPTFPRLQRGHPLARGLVAAWAFHEGSGLTARDQSGQGNHGTLTNGPVWTGGRAGWALKFDAANDYIDLGTLVLFTSGSPFSLSWWEYIVTDTNGFPSRFTFDVAGTTDYFNMFRVKSSANYNYLSWGKSPNTNLSMHSTAVPTTTASVGVWRHFVITGNNPVSTTPGDYALYADGVSVAVAQGGSYGSVPRNRLGWDQANAGTDAILDAIFIHNRRLTSNEVAQLYFDPFAMFRPPRILRSSAVTARPYSYGFIFS